MSLFRRMLPVMLASVALAQPVLADELRKGFETPPNAARPRVWWHWMNGNVTKDGIEKDLAWMEKIGIGGLQNFDANLQTPQIVDKRLVYMDPAWKDAFRHAVTLADQKGLEFAIAASPGWSETGGPWVKPEDGMKKLVWSETVVPGGKRFSGKLAPPPSVTGPFQGATIWDPIAGLTGASVETPPQASGPVGVYAVSVGGVALPVPSFSLDDGSAVPASVVADGNLETAHTVKPNAALILDYGKPVTVRSANLYLLHAKAPFGDSPTTPVLEAEQGGQWTKLGDVLISEASTTLSFPATTARRFRVTFGPFSGKPRPGLGDAAPGAENSFDLGAIAKMMSIRIGEISLSPSQKIGSSEVKAGYGTVADYYEITGNGTDRVATKTVDLSGRMKPDGTLDWTPPKGSDWRIYRFGWSLTGKTNHPATKEATGLEVDKYDPAAVRRYLEHYLGMYRDTVGADMIGKRGIRALLTDSIEVGAANWTANLPSEFKARRGYDITPWMPALAGEVIGSEAETEKFLFDFRATLAEMLADHHYGTVAKVAHENGMIVYGEALEDMRPLIGDDLAMRKHADVPMAALWTWASNAGPRATLIGDMKGAASVAHVYGQNLVAAESMTSAAAPWAYAPRDLKRVIDLEFAHGINRPVIHTSVHQPVDDKVPGLSLMIFGQYFNRHEAWAEMAKPWVDYLSRTSFMLQQGRNHADVAFFKGEEAPVTALSAYGPVPGLPTRYAYDYINADMLADALRAEGGELVAKGGARYKALVLGGSSHMMTLATLQRIAALVDAGATVIGQKPKGSPSLKDDAATFAALADKLWQNARVIAESDSDTGMAKAGIAPDFHFTKPKPDSEILFVHRKLADGEAYFLNNRQNREEAIEARFRVTDKVPELWDAITGDTTPLSFSVSGEHTVIPMTLAPEDAKFVVFRTLKSAGISDAVVAATASAGVTPLDLSWTVSFQPGRGAPASTMMKQLAPLNEHADPGIRYFSGIATYTARFTPPKGIKSGAPLWLDLGQVGDVAEVRVNGNPAGTVWFAPNRVDIGSLIRKGANTLEVRVANVWVNRLIGDKQPGAKPVTFTAAPTYKPDAPLRPAGLIGPVRLVTGGK